MAKFARLSQNQVNDENDEESRNDIYVQDSPIPPQILAEILIRVNNSRDIGFVCPLVCRRWYSVLSAPGFWINYMIYRSLKLPPNSIRSEPSLNVKKVSIKRAFGRNLIKNPSGDENLQSWHIAENGGDGFRTEKPPIGCMSVEDIPVAFVTSYGWCTKFQVIDLWKEGIERGFLDEFCPPITVSDYCSARHDCSSVYVLEVQLLPNGSRPLPPRSQSEFRHLSEFIRQIRYPDPDPDGHHNMSQRDKTTNASIIRVRMLADMEWQKIEHTFLNYPKGIRFVLFQHSGKDDRFWAGHYGAKMTKASVTVDYGNGERRCLPS